MATIDYDIELEFTKNADGTVVGKLIGTTLPRKRRSISRSKRFRSRTVG